MEGKALDDDTLAELLSLHTAEFVMMKGETSDGAPASIPGDDGEGGQVIQATRICGACSLDDLRRLSEDIRRDRQLKQFAGGKR